MREMQCFYNLLSNELCNDLNFDLSPWNSRWKWTFSVFNVKTVDGYPFIQWTRCRDNYLSINFCRSGNQCLSEAVLTTNLDIEGLKCNYWPRSRIEFAKGHTGLDRKSARPALKPYTNVQCGLCDFLHGLRIEFANLGLRLDWIGAKYMFVVPPFYWKHVVPIIECQQEPNWHKIESVNAGMCFPFDWDVWWV